MSDTVNLASLDRLAIYQKTGAPKNYAGSDLMRADIDFALNLIKQLAAGLPTTKPTTEGTSNG